MEGFPGKVNGELVGNLSNLVNRALTFISRFFDGTLGDGPSDPELMKQIREREAEITDLLERAEERDALHAIFELSDLGNKVFQETEPWKLGKDEARQLYSLLYRVLGLLSE